LGRAFLSDHNQNQNIGQRLPLTPREPDLPRRAEQARSPAIEKLTQQPNKLMRLSFLVSFFGASKKEVTRTRLRGRNPGLKEQ